jgi:hypothetical protein
MYPTSPLLGLLFPKTLISPSSGSSKPAKVFSRVVLPIPEAPFIAMISPGLNEKLTPERRGSFILYPTEHDRTTTLSVDAKFNHTVVHQTKLNRLIFIGQHP